MSLQSITYRLDQWIGSRTALLLIFLYLAAMGYTKLVLSQNRLITGDGRYYYAQMRSVIYDGDIDFENDLRMFNPNNKDLSKDQIHPETGKTIIKYPIGNALLFSPVVIATKFLNEILNALGFNITNNGYSATSQFFLCLLSAFYLMLAGFLIYRLLLLFNRSIPLPRLLVVIAFLSSAALYYATMEPSMSHISSLLSVSAYLYFSFANYGKKKKGGQIILISVSAALMILSRNQNITFLLVSLVEFIHLVQKKNYTALMDFLKMSVIGLIMLIPQFIYWKIIFGDYIVYSYGGESFSHYAKPKIFSVLFSRKAGLFFWNPFLLAGLIGSIMMVFERKKHALLLLVLFFIQVYINSSWGCWWLGDAFGYRGLINCMPILVLGMAHLFMKLETPVQKSLFIGLGAFFILVNHLLIFQYCAGWIPHHGPLYYSDVLLNIFG